jgi:transposase
VKDKKKKNRLWSGEFKLKVVLDIIENELSYSQAARKYDMYLSSGSLYDTITTKTIEYKKMVSIHVLIPGFYPS